MTNATTISSTHPARQSGRFINLLAALVVLLALGSFAFDQLEPIVVLPRLAPAPGYRLPDQNGVIVSSEAQRGTVRLFSFTAVDCPNCEQTVEQIEATIRALADESVLPITFVLNNPETLPDTGWTLLNGDAATTKAIVGGGFNLFYRTNDDSSVVWEPLWILVDANGLTRARYHTSTPDPDIVRRDIQLLRAEEEKKGGFGRIGYEAAHLFACYP